MFLYPSAAEGLAWLQGSDQDWADYWVRLFKAAAERRKDEAADSAAS